MSYLRKYFWLLAERGLRLSVSFFLGIQIVRALGPDSFGLFSLALSVATILSPLTTLGIETYLIREFSTKKSNTIELLSSFFYLRCFGGLLLVSIFFVLGKVFAFESEVYTSVIIFLFGFMVSAFTVLDSLLLSEGRTGYSSLLKIICLLVGAALKIVILMRGLGVVYLAGAYLIEACIYALMLHFTSDSSVRPSYLKLPNWSSIQSKLLVVAPLVGTALIYTGYSRIDILMLGWLSDAKTIGQYSAAVRVSEIFNLAIVSLAVIAMPILTNFFGSDRRAFYKKVREYYFFLVVGAFCVSAVVSVFSEQIIYLLYRDAYDGAGKYLAIHAWTIVLVAASSALEPIFYNEGLFKYYFWKVLFAGVVGLLITAVLVKFMSGVGAALGTLVTYFTSVFLSNLIFSKTRWVFYWSLGKAKEVDLNV